MSYDDQGFVILKNIFNPSPIKKISKESETLTTENFIYENDGTLRSLFAPHWYNENLKEFVYNNAAIPYVKEILGKQIYVHQVHFNYKKAKSGGEYAWHSDYTFWDSHDGMPTSNAISVLFLLDDMTLENGPLEILEGSHKLPIIKENSQNWTIKHDAEETDGMITEDMVSKTAYKRHTVLAEAGDVVLMHANAWHTSAANTSNRDRNILFVCYNRLDNKTTLETRPNHIVLRDFTPVS